MRDIVRSFLKQSALVRLRNAYYAAASGHLAFPPGHYHSSIPDTIEIKSNEEIIFGNIPRHLPGIDLREAEQLDLLTELSIYYEDVCFPKKKSPGSRYYYENDFFSHIDAIFLQLIIRQFKPRQIIEVGSGFSSCVTLDTNDKYFDGDIVCTFIEPYPNRLYSLMDERRDAGANVVKERLQDVELSLFSALNSPLTKLALDTSGLV